ncbi:MAG: hypothetical protein KDD53_07520, partial [Bdellovibrionales bacterium]|nr:hypothetical protein [Bdellovibrionales bacterium]
MDRSIEKVKSFVSDADLNSLIAQKSPGSVSIYFPSNDEHGASDKDRIVLKNLYRECQKVLRENGFDARKAKEILSPLTDVPKNTREWPSGCTSFALFVSPVMAEWFALKFPVEPCISVNTHFNVKPLFSALEWKNSFHLLCLSQGNVRLYSGDEYTFEQQTPEDMPENIEEILGEYELESFLQFRTDTPQSRNKRAALFHGHGAGSDQSRFDSRLKEFLQRVDRAISHHLVDSNTPLVIASVSYLSSLFKELSDYP